MTAQNRPFGEKEGKECKERRRELGAQEKKGRGGGGGEQKREMRKWKEGEERERLARLGRRLLLDAEGD